ncbi:MULTISPECIES: hypothetical protein [unclassified Variovorax]|nr:MULTISPECIES: hypothetical protein [unclassified Variovorax]MDM0086063.1 hypothetical protein [Variovorax sp. J22G40]MDM0145680.1 hypothetical protein [Variovorax sp. J2P1-31]
MTSARRHRLLQIAGFAAATAALGGVFLMYTQPAFMVTMIDQLWACF